MKHRFHPVLLNEDGSYQLQESDGIKNLLIRDGVKEYDYESISDIAEHAFYLERSQFGWTVKYKDTDGQFKELFLQGSNAEIMHYTTRSNQSVQEWIDKLYDKDVKQVSLF